MDAKLENESKFGLGKQHRMKFGPALPTAEQQARLREVMVTKYESFPNGSSYDKETLPTGEFDGFSIESVYNHGYVIIWDDGSECMVSFNRTSVGPGADFGIYFCTRDQVLVDLLPVMAADYVHEFPDTWKVWIEWKPDGWTEYTISSDYGYLSCNNEEGLCFNGYEASESRRAATNNLELARKACSFKGEYEVVDDFSQLDGELIPCPLYGRNK